MPCIYPRFSASKKRTKRKIKSINNSDLSKFPEISFLDVFEEYFSDSLIEQSVKVRALI